MTALAIGIRLLISLALFNPRQYTQQRQQTRIGTTTEQTRLTITEYSQLKAIVTTQMIHQFLILGEDATHWSVCSLNNTTVAQMVRLVRKKQSTTAKQDLPIKAKESGFFEK
jgi:hypothetical protein